MTDGPEKTANLAAWVQGLYENVAPAPILVGGAVVELVTRGGYTTGDLDFVGTVPAEVAAKLKSEGFRKQGRHWIHPEGQLFLEFPSRDLEPDEESILLEVAGKQVEVLALEALLVDRLAAWEFWDSTTDAVNAFLVLKSTDPDLELEKIERLVKARGIDRSWRELQRFASEFDQQTPSTEALKQWANRERY